MALGRDRLMELAEELHIALAEPTPSIPRAREIARQIGAASERDGLVRKMISDLATYDLPTIRTRRWLAAMETAHCDEAQGAA